MLGEDSNDESLLIHQDIRPCTDGSLFDPHEFAKSLSNGDGATSNEKILRTKKRNRSFDGGYIKPYAQCLTLIKNSIPILLQFYTDGDLFEASKAEGKEERVVELLMKRSPSNVQKILLDRVDGKLKNVKYSETTSFASFFTLMTKTELPDHQQKPIFNTLKKITENWPARPMLEEIKTKILKINCEELGDDESRWRLIEMDTVIIKSDEASRQLLENAKKLEEIILTEKEVNMETVKDMISATFPCLSLEDLVSEGPTADQAEGHLLTREQYTIIKKDVEGFKRKVFADNGKVVDISEFPGLEDAVKSHGWDIPDNLKSYADRIEALRGKPTEFAFKNALILLCATIKEMEDVQRPEELNRDSLEKWGAILNMAKNFGLPVEFAKNSLEMKFYAYLGFCHSKMDKDTGKKEKKLKGVEIRG